MKRTLILFTGILFYLNLLAQPFQIGHTTVTFTDASRNNRQIATEIYYPADVTGNQVAVTTADAGKFPALSFGHGFVMTWDAYQNIWEAVVPEGFIIAFPKTEGSLSPSHMAFSTDLAYVLTALTALGQDSTSMFYNRVDTMNCVMGHSMGGGAAFLAAQSSPAIKALATLAPAETNPSAIQAAAGASLPAFVFAGENDCVTPPAGNQIPMYNALLSDCKSLISIKGGSHCQMAQSNLLCSIGEGTCTPAPAITRAEQHAIIRRYLIPWLRNTLKGDCTAGAQFDSLLTSDPAISYQNNCAHCMNSPVVDAAATGAVLVFPNPFIDKLTVQCGLEAYDKVGVYLYLIDGRRLFSKTFEQVRAYEELHLNLPKQLPGGIYWLELNTGAARRIFKIIRQ